MSEAEKSRPGFSLIRAYSLVSLIGILVVAVIMAFFYRAVAVDALMKVQNEANADLTRAFANTIWNKYADFFDRVATLPADRIVEQPEIQSLEQDLIEYMRGMRVVKIKIYDYNGITVFSTEKSQIGEAKGDNPGFQDAMRGNVISEIVFRNKFNTFDRVIEDRNLLSSYLPVYYGPDAAIVAVFELYSDITTLLEEVRGTEYKIMALVISLMLALYAFLLVFIRRADLILKGHEQEERAMQQERIRYLAQHDQLTGLPNRGLLVTLLEQAIQRANLTGRTLAVMYLDIDRFKLINDNLGHEAGNQILLKIISRIQQVAGEQHVIARMGGDELVLVREHMPTHIIDGLATRIISRISRPMLVAGVEVTVTVSMGITLFPDDNHDAEHLVKDAEAAMLRAKELGRNRYAFFTEELNIRAGERFELEHGLHRALASQQFELYYQPRVDAVNGQVIGAEALLRWRRDDGSVVSPMLFIPVLEEMGLIIPIGKWVLYTACNQCRQWQEQGYADLRISVNLSVKQFHAESLLSDVRGALLDSGLDAGCLELELTESVLVEDEVGTTKLLNELKNIGVRLSIDDFGTGYSSLSYLMHFPIDCLKIDRAFVRDAMTNTDHANLTRAIVAMARSLHLKTVAEGVETRDQRKFLQALDCDELQGSLFSRPLRPEKFLEYLKQR